MYLIATNEDKTTVERSGQDISALDKTPSIMTVVSINQYIDIQVFSLKASPLIKIRDSV